MKLFSIVILFVSFLASAQDPRQMLLDFEGELKPEPIGSGNLSTEWKASGERSFRIEPKKISYFKQLSITDWSCGTTLQLTFRNPGTLPLLIDLELSDVQGLTSYWNRHQTDFTVQPGQHVINVEYSGGLWRGESGSQYRDLKVPIDTKEMAWIAIGNTRNNSPLFVDKVELVKKESLITEGGLAFDFGGATSANMLHFSPVRPDTYYNPDVKYGFVDAGAKSISRGMIHPTPLLGDGLAWPSSGFRVDLSGGEYLGWVAFERGGYWGENESCQYEHAALTANGTVVHEHRFSVNGIHFKFEDTEITDLADVCEKLLWPAHQISRFKFKAQQGANFFRLDMKNSIRMPLRVAGLILAPATPEGEKFIRDHEKLQRDAVTATFSPTDRSRRDGRNAPGKQLVYESMDPGSAVYPRDWPSENSERALDDQYAIMGQVLCLQFGLYSLSAGTVTVSAAALEKDGRRISDSVISYGRYMPDRAPSGLGATWIDIHHYRPEPDFTIGPELSRSTIIEFTIPKDALPGTYTSEIKFSGIGEPVSIPVKVHVVKAKLADIPIPMGLCFSAPAVRKDQVDEATFWRLQEHMIAEQFSAGLSMLTNGAAYRLENGKLNGDDAINLIKIAQKYGMVRAVVPYYGFLSGIVTKDYSQLAKALGELEQLHALPPHYVTVYDEPTTDPEYARVLSLLPEITRSGIRTCGLTSSRGHQNQKLWHEMLDNTHTVILNIHTPNDLQSLKNSGRHPWVYNQGRTRYHSGLHLWRSMRYGVEGRIDYAANWVSGFAFHNLDGREPALSSFAVHSKFGTLKAPMWLAQREGYLDCRIRLTLEGMTKPDDPTLNTWTIDVATYRTDEADWSVARLQKTRRLMLERIGALASDQ
jgi:hypothetical protein